jgi:GH15 family glucan-1,4-alpha-glucosidase
MRTHLYSETFGRFLRALQTQPTGEATDDPTIDASMFALFYFGCFDVNDPLVENTMKAIEENLSSGAEFNGIARYQNDGYMRVSEDLPGNSWFICTLWLAEYYIARAKTPGDLAPALKILQWCVDRALPSGVLAEQVNPLTRQRTLGLSPSHGRTPHLSQPYKAIWPDGRSSQVIPKQDRQDSSGVKGSAVSAVKS